MKYFPWPTPDLDAKLYCLLTDGSTNSQLSKLWCGDFVRLAAMPVLRIKARHNCLPVLLRYDVHWQQALSALRRCGGTGHRRGTVGVEVPALQDGHGVDHSGRGGHA